METNSTNILNDDLQILLDRLSFGHDSQGFVSVEGYSTFEYDPSYEFDAPTYFDLETWSQRVDLFGMEAYQETPSEKRINDKWFRQHHLDHEHDFAFDAPNLLKELEEQEKHEANLISHESHLAKFVLDFANELAEEEKEVVTKEEEEFVFCWSPKLQGTSADLRFIQKRFPRSFDTNFKYTLAKKKKDEGALINTGLNNKNGGGLIRNERRLFDIGSIIKRNVTNRQEKEDLKFIKDNDVKSQGNLTRVLPSICVAPSSSSSYISTARESRHLKPLKQREGSGKEVSVDELKELLLAQNALSKAIRLQKTQSITQKTGMTKSFFTSSLSHSTINKHTKAVKANKDEDDILNLLKQHNRNIRKK